MSKFKNSVSIQPYFTVQDGKMDGARQVLDRCVEASANEQGSYFYNFTINGNVVFCREYYADADAVLTHLGNVGALIEELLKLSELTRCEVHGPGAQLEKWNESTMRASGTPFGTRVTSTNRTRSLTYCDLVAGARCAERCPVEIGMAIKVAIAM